MLSINMLIQYDNNPESIERIVFIDDRYQTCFLINIFDASFPIAKEVKEVEGNLDIGSAKIIERDPWALLLNENDISKKARLAQEKAWTVVKQLLECDVDKLLSPNRRNTVINRIADNMGINPKTVAKYLKRYWKRGMYPDALLPDFRNKGCKGQERQSGERKRGRPRKSKQVVGEGINIDEEIKGIFRIAAQKYYETKKNVSVKFAYEQMIKEFFREELEESPEKLPTYTQFLYWIRKEQNLSQEIIRRTGKRNFDLSYRPLLGSATNEVRSPLEKVQIDATVADVYLTSEFGNRGKESRNWIIGRPILYFCKCVYSSMIVGFHVGLEGPNFEQARLALMNTVEDKVEFCKRFDIDIVESQWPTAHLPSCIVADRAELLSNASNVLTEKLNIRIENSGSWRGDLKSLIERQFGLFSDGVVKPMLPGAVDKDFGKRGTRDHRLSGKLTLSEFKKIIINYILYFNNHYVLENYVMDEEMIRAGVEPIPIKLWEWGMQNRAGRLRAISKELLMLNLLPEGTATVTESGIKFKNIYYGSDLALKEQWFVQARYKKSWKIPVKYDPRNLSELYIQGIHDNGFERCYLLKHQSRYENKAMEDINYLQEYEKMQKNGYKQNELKAKVDLIEAVEKIVKNAEKEAKAEGVKESNNKRIKDIKEHRKVEQEKLYQQEKNSFQNRKKERKEKQTTVIPMSVVSNDDLQLLKSMQKKGIAKREE
ncbi:Mu transposase C-terminal domain-containing protein [Virgibacillus sp. SK37]|uniref:Mu transposase C-terminal domain-containing protein n=1 Tax=Virgibacillus sp. SK37 TaxID=403957 RepID=UPI0004D1C328|nr:Mu transposase C-terminal domain-containing protein [Virgibacillus sp. SK37]AIF42154.1 DNA-binding protein [Virgibacillus sp. SK37]